MHEFEEAICAYCDTRTTAINLDGCLICETFKGACSECMTEHRKSHADSEIEAFRRQMMDEPELTPRERISLELKQRIRQQAETLCKLIDDQEWLVKKYERQCVVLAQEVDRLTPVA